MLARFVIGCPVTSQKTIILLSLFEWILRQKNQPGTQIDTKWLFRLVAVDYFTKSVNPSLDNPPLEFKGSLAKFEWIFIVKYIPQLPMQSLRYNVVIPFGYQAARRFDIAAVSSILTYVTEEIT